MEELEDMIEADDLEWSEQGFSLLDAYRRWNAKNVWTDREDDE
jgi:hypothetical protein